MDISVEILRSLLDKMLLIRCFEEKIIEVYPLQDMKTPVHLYIGEEAVASGVCQNLEVTDYVFSNHRSHGHCLAKGASPGELLAEFYGRVDGCCRGKGGSMHPVAPEVGILGTSAIVGGGIALAVGTALASWLRKQERVSVAFFGDGATDEGIFHESLNFASLKKLPVLFVCENNFYATNSPLAARQPHSDIARRAEGYGMPGVSVDGNDVLAVYRAAREAVERARSGGGPTLLECKTYRWKGHVGPDCDYEKGCRSQAELEEWMGKCPLVAYREYLLGLGIISEEEYAGMVRRLNGELDEAIRYAKASPFPALSELTTDVYYAKKN